MSPAYSRLRQRHMCFSNRATAFKLTPSSVGVQVLEDLSERFESVHLPVRTNTLS